MLFITRKVGQTIKIGDEITITVAPNKPGFAENIVTIGIEAPKAIHIIRGELVEHSKKENGKTTDRRTKDKD